MSELQSTLIGQKVVVRTYSAGVHIGTLEAKSGKEVRLTDAHRAWYWKGAFTLNEVATKGVAKGSKIGVAVPTIELTEAIEIIPISDEAFATLEAHVERA
ncbi:hypothetical protein [Brevundimonas sp.]|uniref:DUF6948 domain-containing protein n=1 Tax=Brevundimonas sp. TaxID=1871086 RepID=UPI0025C28695|nr:hypothetical protein [Brevundimonas sp.]MCG2662895.1 hypothetical protein [Brevundimonas sp.]